MNYIASSLIIVFTAVVFFIFESCFPLHSRTQHQNIKNTIYNLIYGAFSIGLTSALLKAVDMQFPSIEPLKNYFSDHFYIQIITCIFISDLIAWSLHILNHRLKILWRLHSVHHSDQFLNTSSAIRFHILEILYSSVLHMLIAMYLGFSDESILIYRTLFTVSNLFQHSNIAITYKIDRAIAFLFVTPRYHHVHHSVVRAEQNSHFGSIFSFWDRLVFNNTTLAQTQLQYGIDLGQNNSNSLQLLWMPFLKQSEYFKNKR